MLSPDNLVELTDILRTNGFEVIEDTEHLEFYNRDEKSVNITITRKLFVSIKIDGITTFEKQVDTYNQLKIVIVDFLEDVEER